MLAAEPVLHGDGDAVVVLDERQYSVSKRTRVPRSAACAEDDRLDEVLRDVAVA